MGELHINDVAEMLHAALIERGEILTDAIVLENVMNVFLAKHFCMGNGKEVQIIETIFATSKYRFDQKRDTIQAVLKDGNSYAIDGRLLCKTLQEIGRQRNIMAHWPLDVSDEYVSLFKSDGILTFLKVENSTQPESLTIFALQELKDKIKMCTDIIKEL